MKIERSKFFAWSVLLSCTSYAAAFITASADNSMLFTVLVVIGMAIAGIGGSVYDRWDFFGIVVNDYVDYNKLEEMIRSRIAELNPEN